MVMAFSSVFVNAQFSKAQLQATGLTCAMCSNAINKALQSVPFVESVKSDIKNSAFNIVFKHDAVVNIDALQKAVDEAGFSVGSLSLTGNFQKLSLSADKHFQIGQDYFHFVGTGNPVLDGENTITIVDRNFVTAKQFKKFSSATKMPCILTGKAASCCTKEGVSGNSRIYHITI